MTGKAEDLVPAVLNNAASIMAVVTVLAKNGLIDYSEFEKIKEEKLKVMKDEYFNK